MSALSTASEIAQPRLPPVPGNSASILRPTSVVSDGDGVTLEWYAQAAEFDKALAGKTAAEIGGLVVEGYGSEELQTAGCSISVGDMVAAAVKAATVA